jgi:tetratricopeptide (TPR) repeat protein
MRADWHGLPTTTDSDTAIAAFDAAIEGYVTYAADTPQRIGKLLEIAPEMTMAHVFKGNMILLTFKAAALPIAAEALVNAKRLARGATEREKAHTAALDALLAGDIDRALGIWEQIIDEHPSDILAFRLHHINAFWIGRPATMSAVVEATLPRYDRALPAYGTMLACRAFADEELGNYARAEIAGREAIEIDASDVYAAHAVAHVLEMQGRREEGIQWLKTLEPHWGRKNNLKHHLWWHRGLYHLERAEFDEVLRLYDNNFRNLASPLTQAQPDLYLDVQNAASILFRLSRHEVDVENRWQELADHAERRIGDCLNPFTLPHWMMALAATKRYDKAEAMLEGMRAFATCSNLALGHHVRDFALPVSEAVLAHGKGKYSDACDVMRPAIAGMYRLGGSHAQQDVLEQLFLDSAERGGSSDDMRLIIDRVRSRHPVAPENRIGYARAAERLTH